MADAELSKLRVDFAALSSKSSEDVRDLRGRLSATKSDATTTANDLAESDRIVKSLREEISSLQDAKSELEVSRDALESSRADLASRLEQREVDLRKSEEERDKARDASRAAIDALREKVASLEAAASEAPETGAEPNADREATESDQANDEQPSSNFLRDQSSLSDPAPSSSDGGSGSGGGGEKRALHPQASTGDGAPLLFAMAKQGELKLANEELGRLASKVADLTSDRQEALDRCSELEERLSSSLSKNSLLSTLSGAESSVNAEYLKNILLQFLMARTTQEKCRLLPVIAAVLSFTDSERAAAMSGIESSLTEAIVDRVQQVKSADGIMGALTGLVGLSPARPSARPG